MKIKLLIATEDIEYAQHLANVLSDTHADAFEVNMCSTTALLEDLLKKYSFDAVLFTESFSENIDFSTVRLPILLWDEQVEATEQLSAVRRTRKYQRISSLAGTVLEACTDISIGSGSFDHDKAFITAIWSAAGGVGKTTVALAYATKKAAEGKQVLYLDLDHFSTIPLYFTESGKSISVLFEKLDGNAELLARGICQQDSSTGIRYFCHVDNYDDMNILSTEDLLNLIKVCSVGMDELILDLPGYCDERIQQIFKVADKLMLVTDATGAAQVKLQQFFTQHNVFKQIRSKTMLIANKGAIINNFPLNTPICLPLISTGEACTVYKTLSGYHFGL
ncbi:MAG: hypothetical protein FWG61_01050 [Firmicutes bacterium]|nr:hypothetical protein [Bacillota bacterium]